MFPMIGPLLSVWEVMSEDPFSSLDGEAMKACPQVRKIIHHRSITLRHRQAELALLNPD